MTPHLTYPNLKYDTLVHGTFRRQGGVSVAPYDSLNASFHVGDAETAVRRNREIMKKTLGLATMVSARQVHGARIKIVTDDPGSDNEFSGFDGLVTNIHGLGLMIQQADCQAVLFFDPVQLAVGIAHAGWRGSVANIIAATVNTMINTYGTSPSDLRAAISPSLGPCCAEFVNYQTELPEAFCSYQVRDNHFDFWAISRDQLSASGLEDENIFTAGICTVCNHDYFSYRREKETGRFASVIGIRQ